MQQELKGEIAFFNRKKEIGMIHAENKKSYYFKKGDYEEVLEEDEKVIFKERESIVESNHKIYFAKNIRKYNG